MEMKTITVSMMHHYCDMTKVDMVYNAKEERIDRLRLYLAWIGRATSPYPMI